MGILEIILAVFAWRKGWKWMSLIPIAIAFVIGLICGLSGGTPSDVILVDVIAIIALAIMCFKKPDDIFKNDTPDETKKES